MACYPGTPCFNSGTVVYPTGCGIDPCYLHKTGTDLVFYNGANLPCVGVDTCDSVTLSFQKIDQKLCPDALSISVFGSITNNLSIHNMFCALVGECASPTTTTTSTSSTTTTTTTIAPFTCNSCVTYLLVNNTVALTQYTYVDCYGVVYNDINLEVNQALQICVCGGNVTVAPGVTASPIGVGCNPIAGTTTTTTTIPG